ncbi:MAG: Holliday junction branch migration protein RuvA [Rhodospirillaceae bacterium]
MIAKLTGLVDNIGEDWVVLDVGGVGYMLFCSSRTLTSIPQLGEAMSLFVETHVREDHIHLYGFATSSERNAFQLVNRVQGVGTKVALAILSAMSPEQLSNAVAAEDKVPFTSASGVGPKLAARLVTELKGKVDGVAGGIEFLARATGEIKGTDNSLALTEDAISALVNLGYGRADAFGAVSSVVRAENGTNTLDHLIRDALKELSSDG